MIKFKNQFCNKDFDDFTEYRYDVTNYMRDLMGDCVKFAYAKVGVVFKTDEIDEQDKDIRRMYSVAAEIDKNFESSGDYEITSDKLLYIFFEGGKSIEISTYDFAYLGKAGESAQI